MFRGIYQIKGKKTIIANILKARVTLGQLLPLTHKNDNYWMVN